MNKGATSVLQKAIAANPVLSELQASSRETLLESASLQEMEKGETICRQEAAASRFWLVLRGEVKLLTYTTRGAALLMDIVLPNQLFGIVLYQDDPVYSSTAEALKRTEVLSFKLNILLKDLEKNPSLQKTLLAEAWHKLSRANQMRGLWLEEASVRIAHQLLYLSEKFGRIIPHTRATIAELAGTSVETAIRISNVFARQGVVATRRGQIEIICLSSLQACARGRGRDTADL